MGTLVHVRRLLQLKRNPDTMNSPDTTRLAAALAKLDDPEIITLLLEVVLPKQMTDTTPAEPVQQELLGHIQSRREPHTVPARNARRVWRTNQIMQLRAMHNAGMAHEEIAEKMGRSTKAVRCAIDRYIRMTPGRRLA